MPNKPVSYFPATKIKAGVSQASPGVDFKLRWPTGFILLAVMLLGACSNRTELDESVQKLVFKTISGEKIALSERKKATLINFWSTSCAICIAEMPELAEVYEQYSEKGFELIAVAMPYDPPNEVVEFSEAHQYPFPVALDIKGDALKAFATVKGTPTSYLLNADGKLVKRYVGAVDFDGLRGKLDELLGSG